MANTFRIIRTSLRVNESLNSDLEIPEGENPSFWDMFSTYFLKVNLGSLDLRVGVDSSGVSVGLVTSD